MELPEDMTDSRTRNCLDSSAALPNSEGHFQILATPSIHFVVVAANLPEILPMNGQQTASHRRTIGGARFDISRFAFAPPSSLLAFAHIDPVKVTVPREAAHLKVVVPIAGIVKVLCVDHIDYGH